MAAGGSGRFCRRKPLEATINHTCSVVPPRKATLAQSVAFSFPSDSRCAIFTSVPRESRLESIRDSTYVPRRDRGWRECEHTWGVLDFPITTSHPPKIWRKNGIQENYP